MAVFKVLIVDDHPVVLTGLTLILSDDPLYEICGRAASPAEACILAEREQPDIIISDLAMAGEEGTMLVEDLLAIAPTARILIYSSQEESQWAPRVIRSGARGFISKAEPLDTVALGLNAIIAGELYLSALAQRLLVTDFAQSRPSEPRALSIRERQVLRLLAEGEPLQSLAQQLGLSVKTVGTYRERLKVKLGLDSVRKLERFAADYVAGRAALP